MENEELSIDELLADVRQYIDEPAAQESAPKSEKKAAPAPKKKKKKKEHKVLKAIAKVIGCLLLFIVETALLLVVALYGVMYVVCEGPSPSAGELFVMSVRETSAIGFLAELFYTPEEIAAIENKDAEILYEDTDVSLIVFPTEPTVSTDPTATVPEGPQPDAWGLIDEDGDGIIVEEVKGEGYSGYMMVVLDPSRVIMGCRPGSFGSTGYTVASMVKSFDAVAGINAGGFLDPDGHGDGSEPDSMVVFEGKIYSAENGVRNGFVGLDSNHILHVGKFTVSQVREKDIQYGVCFGPVLISNGEPCEGLSSGVNPRTAIGQRSDGAILMLVIDGRQVISIGATFQDMVDIFLSYGAVNACNLDGGSSSLMWYNGGYINNCASVIGIRPVPTTFLVLKEGANSNG